MADVNVNQKIDANVNVSYIYLVRLRVASDGAAIHIVRIDRWRDSSSWAYASWCVTALAMRRAPMWLWAIAAVVATYLWQSGLVEGQHDGPELGLLSLIGWIPALLAVLMAIPAVRRMLLVEPAFAMVKKILPKVSDTEQEALDAGTIGFDAELFSGDPDWEKLRAVPPIVLTPEEKAFIDGPCEELCRMVDDWQIRFNDKDIPDAIWKFVGRHGFLGMLISKEHGGLGFSAQAQSLILGKIASRSPDVATIVMVPNSLGPGELIEKYGTDEQKHYYLPRLAKGLEIPCFSLTGPTSGSDAATMRDIGTVVRGMHEGRETLGIKLSWDKRYITLGPKATLVGLAFRLFDPDKLIGDKADIGITLALIPASHPGVNIGRRHLPSGSAFPNGPNWGKDVFIPIDWVIGGQKMAGHGWRMLMECLAAGRAISLPSSATAAAKAMLRFTTAYTRIRKQFGLPIAKMEGIEEPLARMVETAYVNEAARAVTAAMVARGEKPSVISALMKYQTTERMRRTVNDAMDIHGGRAICDGPTNYIQAAYQAVPVGITVEGANILTRTLITFAQGALRSHPYLYKEVKAVQDADAQRGLVAFEDAFLGHIQFAVGNVFGALFHNLTGGLLGARAREGLRHRGMVSPAVAVGAQLRAGRRSDGGAARRRPQGQAEADRPSRRRAVGTLHAVLRAEALRGRRQAGRRSADRGTGGANGLYRFQVALRGTIENFPVDLGAHTDAQHRLSVGQPLSSGAAIASAHEVVRLAIEPGEVRDRLTRFMFVSKDVERSDRPARSDAREGDRGGSGREEARSCGARRDRHALPWPATGSATR